MIFKEREPRKCDIPSLATNVYAQIVSSYKPYLSPLGSKCKPHRSYLIQNGITHYNVFGDKGSCSREKAKTPLVLKSMFRVYLKNSNKTDSLILPKLSTSKIKMRSKTGLNEKSAEKDRYLNDKNLGTDD